MKVTLEKQIWFSPKASKRLISLRPVFNELRAVHEDYINNENGRDCPYWYSERPHTGLLASAVWRRGGTALEEYRTHKRKNRTSAYGRCDLYIGNPKFECEAKRLWLNLLSVNEDSNRKVLHHLNWAADDVKKLNARRGLALCFVTPAIHRSRLQVVSKRICQWLKILRNSMLYDALIWIGFKENWNHPDGTYIHPGVLLAIKEVKGSS